MSTSTSSRTNAGSRERRNESSRPVSRAASSHRGMIGWIAAIVLAAIAGAGIVYGWSSHAGQAEDSSASSSSNSRSSGSHSQSSPGAGGDSGNDDSGNSNASRLKVKVVEPKTGGLTRTTTQPGVVHAFEYADIYAKASGFLTAQVVDIGDTVERGQVLAEIYDPERQQEVEQAAAAVEQAKAQVQQAEAQVATDEAAVTAAEALVAQRNAEVKRYVAERKYYEKEYLRFIELVHQKAVDQRVADEKQKQYESGVAGEQEALAKVRTAEAELAKAKAQVLTSKANVAAARAKERMLKARETQAAILASYLKIISPYDGVVTNRNYHRGDFIRSADAAGQLPIISVARTDLMRVVVHVPDRDVQFLDRGDEAVVRVDALGGEQFPGKVARFSEYEDSVNRTMRAEIDLPNPAGRLYEGMYGGVTILLDPPSSNLVIPSSAIHDKSDTGEATIFVVRGDNAYREKVRVGRDNGIRTEVTEGLKHDDLIVVSYSGSLEDGEPVIAERVGDSAGDNQQGSDQDQRKDSQS